MINLVNHKDDGVGTFSNGVHPVKYYLLVEDARSFDPIRISEYASSSELAEAVKQYNGNNGVRVFAFCGERILMGKNKGYRFLLPPFEDPIPLFEQPPTTWSVDTTGRLSEELDDPPGDGPEDVL